ncbi:ABC transporter permease [Larkinella knui]|uniref:FtsX-like permease family protein n=1 Tax=Larkinella knui TaxID=2025310 RepID=A0A3P1CE02_9BACT|nr:ABC transporter permease [Larkinella knui]RRB11455.1 FtsX-like permease family protein [Larkinella knui]
MNPTNSPNHRPPRWATALLDWWGDPDTVEEVQGDLLELYDYWVQTAGKRQANWRYGLSVLKLVRPLAKPKRSNEYASPFFLNPDMIRNYLKIAFRTLVKNKAYSTLTLLGLAVGMTCAILLSLYVRDELNYDRYHQHANRISRLNLHIKWEGNEYKLGVASAPMGPALQREYPEIRQVLRVQTRNETLFRAGENVLYAKNIIYADSTLFTFFDYEFIQGSPQTALLSPNSVVLTQKLAVNLFGKTDGLLGKVVLVKDQVPVTVAGVIRDAPANHHLKFEAILPYSNEKLNGISQSKWDSFNSMTYVLLNQDSDRGKLEAKMPGFYKKYIARTIGDVVGKKVQFDITFQPLADMHLRSTHLMGEENGGNLAYVYTFSAIGLFILLIAVVNYINLATARSAGRAKEIGVRKAIGSLQFQLMGQFLAESMLLSFLALVASLVLLYALLPGFNLMTAKTLTIDLWNIRTVLQLTGFALVIGFVSGLYPAFILSRFKPAAVLKGAFTTSGKGALLRKSLVVVQFTISMVMIVGTIIVYRQLQFMRHTQLGFNQEQVLSIPLKIPSVQKTITILKSKLQQNPVIKGVSLTNGAVGGEINDKSTFSFYAGGTEQSVSTEYFSVDHDFLNVLQIKLKEGRNFSPDLASDSAGAVLVNEAMLKRLGWKNRTVGLIEFDTKKIPVAGVIRDFHLRSLHNKIEPLVLVLHPDRGDNLLIRVSPQNIPAALAYVKAVYEEVNPNQPFEYTFLDQIFAEQYRSDEQKGGLFIGFSGIAIFIACLGLFGLATFTAEQRTKEIGVRKVLGASVASVVALLSKDFLKLVGIAILIASPIAWYGMNRWLQDFAYKIDIEWWVFALAGLLAIGIALLTISFQSIKAALMNPVRSLRSE